ncbi:MAG TPA: META domain-containing protein, partial [Anaerolineales bacterium]|nr:META domain-containing protein [Anaerolineales bacterium]
MKNVLIGLLALVVLVACSGGSTAAIQGQWELISYGPPSGQTPAASDVDTTIEFDSEGRMTGNVGCNGFG